MYNIQPFLKKQTEPSGSVKSRQIPVSLQFLSCLAQIIPKPFQKNAKFRQTAMMLLDDKGVEQQKNEKQIILPVVLYRINFLIIIIKINAG
ncbi:hypothetical protein SDC9_116120 [bioreactor metagenome]|uniref:Uncharacterized protein n=1 Tax=bioreactor metagenome TaxID=1076179 RepID=A0A645BUR0_9ZZZZ